MVVVQAALVDCLDFLPLMGDKATERIFPADGRLVLEGLGKERTGTVALWAAALTPLSEAIEKGLEECWVSALLIQSLGKATETAGPDVIGLFPMTLQDVGSGL